MSKYVRSLAFVATVGLALAPAAHAAQAVQHTLPPRLQHNGAHLLLLP